MAKSAPLISNIPSLLPKTSEIGNGKLEGLSVPTQYGTVRAILKPATPVPGRIVIHIQDIHLNQEAQNNIVGAIQELAKNQKIAAVALEAHSTHRP